MAKLTGLFQFEGTLDGYSVVKTKDGSYLRRKGGISKERMETDPKLIRLRENMKEFGMSAKASKLIRTAFRCLKCGVRYGSLIGRLATVLARVKKMDVTSIRGERKVAVGLGSEEGRALLKGMRFNGSIAIESVMSKPYNIDVDTGDITINSLVAGTDLRSSAGASGISFKGYWGKLDFFRNVYVIAESSETKLTMDSESSDVKLTFAHPPVGDGTHIFVLAITCFQTVNGVDYVLQDESCNLAEIVGVY